jgi:hypothetical protein
MHQEHIRFSARTADDIPQVTKAQESLVLCWVRTLLLLAPEDSRAATQEGRARSTQNKVLVIMDYGNFRKQAYRGTGSQRDSILEVTDSIQRDMGRSSSGL